MTVEGPLELLVLTFPGDEIRGEVVRAFDLVRSQAAIRIVDILFIQRHDGPPLLRELADLDDAQAATLGLTGPVQQQTVFGWLSKGDLDEIAADVPPSSTAVVVLFEHTWARALRGAVVEGGGVVTSDARISNDRVAEIEPLFDHGDPTGRYGSDETTLRRAAVVRRSGVDLLGAATSITRPGDRQSPAEGDLPVSDDVGSSLSDEHEEATT
jgi:hypothetical protein